jgi:hypothetical protein
MVDEPREPKAEEGSSKLPSGWVPLGKRSTLSLLRGVAAPPSYLASFPLVVVFVLQVAQISRRERGTLLAIVGLPLASLALVVLITLLVFAIKYLSRGSTSNCRSCGWAAPFCR